MQSFDTKLEDVILLNQRQNWMIKNSGLYRLNEYKNYEQLSNLMNVPDNTSWVLNPSSLFYSEESINVTGCDYSISLIKKLPTNKLQKYGLALANIPACSLQDFINSEVDPLDSIIVLNESGTILLHPDRSMIGEPAQRAVLLIFHSSPILINLRDNSKPSWTKGLFRHLPAFPIERLDLSLGHLH